MKVLSKTLKHEVKVPEGAVGINIYHHNQIVEEIPVEPSISPLKAMLLAISFTLIATGSLLLVAGVMSIVLL